MRAKTVMYPQTAAICVGLLSISSMVTAETFEGFTEPFRSIDVSASDSGSVSEINVKRGDRVESGQLLIALDSTVLEASRRVAEMRTRSVARIEALRIEHQLREDRYRQLLALHDEGAGSAEEVKRAKADVDVAKLNIQAAEEELAKSRLELGEIEARLDQRRVRSPVDAIVTDVRKEVGEYVSVTEPHCVTIVQLEKLRVTFYLPTPLALTLKPGQSIALSFPDFKKRTDGQIEYVARVTEADSGRVRVDVLLDNTKGEWRSGVRCVTAVHN